MPAVVEGARGPVGPKGDKGDPGTPGTPGAAGQSAYQLAVAAGFVGTETAWRASLKGDPGTTGPKGDKGDTGDTGATGAASTVPGPQGDKGDQGDPGTPGADGADGASGLSAYQVWLAAGNTGTVATYLASLKGAKGDTGTTGATGATGPQGDPGTPGATGASGLSAYEVWLAAGHSGTVSDYLASLAGAAGATGAAGADGKTVLSGTGAPASGTGALGDFYIDTSVSRIYGPKTGGGWGSGTSLVGPQGSTGATGATGPTGPTATILDEGTARTSRSALNFVGAGVTATDDSVNGRTLITIPGGTFAPTDWLGSSAYASGDLVKYAQGLYRAKTSKSTPGAPTLGTCAGLTAVAQVGDGVPFSGTVDRSTDPALPSSTLKGDVLQVKVTSPGTFTLALSGAWTSGTGNRDWFLKDSSGTTVFSAQGSGGGFTLNGGTINATVAGTYFLCIGIWTDDTSRAYTATITNGTGAVEGAPSNPDPATDTTTWDRVVQGVVNRPTVVTSLPGSPVDGQEVYYLADSTNGILWHLRYRAASSSSYKWECIGGSDLSSEVQTKETTGSLTYVDLTTVGPQITLPLAGDYEFLLVANEANATAGAFSFSSLKFSTAAPSDNDAAIVMSTVANGESHVSQVNTPRTVPTAGTVAKVQYRVNTGTGSFQRRRLTARPIRVG